MLELTLGTDFVPGTNLRGHVAGANWVYLLPQLHLGTTLCVGRPSVAALHTLAALADTVIVRLPPTSQIATVPPSERSNVTTLVCPDDGPCPLARHSVDLLYLSDNRLLRSWRGLPDDIRRVLRPEGYIYVEARGFRRPIALDLPLIRFWLTPLHGEMHTAVPVGDDATQRFFVSHRLFSPSITIHTIKDAARKLRQRRPATEPTPPAAPPQDAADESSAGNARRRRAFDTWRRLGNQVIDSLATIEGWLHRRISPAGRYGVLAGHQIDPALSGPPAYLRALAEAAGIDLAHHRWGLWAGGQYSSRKLLFFLFDPASGTLNYLVKMVRDTRFNTRLENESRALKHLEALGFAARHALPRVAFEGHHHGLAIVGETAVNGVPFKDKTHLTASCPFAQDAIRLLTDLGQATAIPDEATPQLVAVALRTLFERFQAIYRLPATEADFLATQIATLSAQNRRFPLVFQHGDPGPWNMLVTPQQQVTLLDWESAEILGMPLWDLFYFLRSYAVNVARATGNADRLRGFEVHFCEQSPLNTVIVEAVQAYCARIGLDASFVEPLFYTCWMHRALKQATLLQSHKLAQGYYATVLRRAIQRHDAPGLRRLFDHHAINA